MELAPKVKQIAGANAEKRGLSREEYLPDILAHTLRQEDWAETVSEEPLGRLTMRATEPRLSRIWDTPEGDAAWKYLANCCPWNKFQGFCGAIV